MSFAPAQGLGGVFSSLSLSGTLTFNGSTLVADAANVLALKNGATAQEFRVYGTTTGPKYASLLHNGTDALVSTPASSGDVCLAPAGVVRFRVNGAGTVTCAADLTFDNSRNLSLPLGSIVTDTSTGLKIGTGTTQKIGFFNAAPVAQGASVADAAGGAFIDAEARTALNALISRIEATGLIATV